MCRAFLVPVLYIVSLEGTAKAEPKVFQLTAFPFYCYRNSFETFKSEPEIDNLEILFHPPKGLRKQNRSWSD